MKNIKKLATIFALLFLSLNAKAGTISPSSLTTFIQVNGLSATTTQFAIEIASAVSHGFGAIDMNMDQWALLEPSSGVYSASALADLKFKVNLATAAGLVVTLQLPINNSNGWLPIAFSTPVTDPFFGAIGYTHYVTSDTGKMYWISFKVSTTIGPSANVRYRAWNEPDLKYSFCDSTAPTPARVSSYMNVITAQRSGVFDALAPSTPVFEMAGISQPNGYGTLEGYTTFYAPTGSWGRQFIAAGGGALTDVWNMHCYGDAGCTMDMIATTVTFWNNDFGSTKPVRVSEANTFGGSYPSSDHEFEERRKAVWLATACVQAIGTYGFSSFQVQPLDTTDQAIMTSTFSDRTSGIAWRNFNSIFTGKTWIRDYNVGTLNVSIWRNSSTGRRAILLNSRTGTNSADFFGKPSLCNVYDAYGNLTNTNVTPSGLGAISVSSQTVILQELTPPLTQTGKQ